MNGKSDVSDWWRTKIIDMEPGRIALRGTPVEELIGTTGFAEMIWLMVMGTRPSAAETKLLEAALVQQQMDAFAGGQPALLVDLGDLLVEG